MNGIDYYLEAFRRYFDFDGRSRRSEYWYFVLFNFVISITLFVCVFLIPFIGLGAYVLYALAVFFPNLALIIRRLHDTNRSGWNFFFAFIPLAGFIIMLIFLTEEGTHGPNQYGPDPKAYMDEDSYI